jgi:hypothetical protein
MTASSEADRPQPTALSPRLFPTLRISHNQQGLDDVFSQHY